MLNLTKDSIIDFQSYKSDLEYLGYIYIEIDSLLFASDVMEQQVFSIASVCRDIIATKSGYFLCELNKSNIIKYLIDYEQCPEKAFDSKKTEGETLNSSKVLIPLLEKGYAVEFLTSYMEYTSMRSVKGLINGLIERAEETEHLSCNGKKLYKISFSVNEADNLRVYYRNHSIQSIPKLYSDCITVKPGYFMVSGDFKQSDLRIAYNLLIRTEENFDIMMAYDDKYEGFSRILLGESFELEDFKEHREDVYKVNALAPIYGATHSSSEAGQAFIRMANRYLKTCPNYSEFKRRLQRRLDLDLPLKITTYFGNIELITDNNVKSGNKVNNSSTKSYFNSLKMNKALNAPIQTGTSEIVIACEQSIMREFEKVGATPENGGIYAYINRHDELIFMVRNDFIEYSDIFRSHQTIQVDDWIPLSVEFEYQRYYTQIDEDLTKLAKSYYKAEETFVPKQLNKKPFIPSQDVLEISIGTFFITHLNKTVVSYYDYINNKCSVDIIEGNNLDEVYNEIASKLVINSGVLKEKDINCAYICTQLVSNDNSVFRNILMRFTRYYDSTLLSKANLIAEYGAVSYCKSNNINLSESESLRTNLPFVKSVINNGDIFKVGD